MINTVVGQVQGAFQQQQTATQEQAGQIAGAVQSLQQQLTQLVQTAANLTTPGQGGAVQGPSHQGRGHRVVEHMQVDSNLRRIPWMA